MSETRKTTLSILCVYVASTTIFLGILFSVWYFGELNLLKTRSFHDIQNLSKRLIYIAAKQGRYAPYTQSLQAQKALLQSLSLESGFLLAVFDKNGELIYNNTRLNLALIPKQDGVYILQNHTILTSFGRPTFLLNQPKTQPKLEDEYRIIIDGGEVGLLLWKLRLKIWGLFGVIVIMVAIVGAFLVRLSLRPLNQKIQELNQFIKDTTHEINTPLSVLQMSVSGLDQNALNPRDKKRLRSIIVSAKTLENIYDALIYTAFGRLENQIQLIDMRQLIQERLEFFEMLFDQKSLTLSTALSPAILKANPKSITLVVDNLLSNAYKYTPKNGEVKVFLQSKGGECLLVIEDNGYGIEKKNLPYIFNRYQRFERSKGGFGLGLNIVKKICDEFGILITCESEINIGSNFSLRWREENN